MLETASRVQRNLPPVVPAYAVKTMFIILLSDVILKVPVPQKLRASARFKLPLGETANLSLAQFVLCK